MENPIDQYFADLDPDFDKFLRNEKKPDLTFPPGFVFKQKALIDGFKATIEYKEIKEDINQLINLKESEVILKFKKAILGRPALFGLPEIKDDGNKDDGNKDDGNKDDGNKDDGNKDDELGKIKWHISLLKQWSEYDFPPVCIMEDLLPLFFLVLMADYEVNFSGEQLLEKERTLIRFFACYNMELNLKKFRSVPGSSDISSDILSTIKYIGYNEHIFDSTRLLESHGLQKLFHKIVSSKHISKRHEERKQTYQSAYDEADRLWGKMGDNRTINEMVDHLISREGFSSLTKKALREKIYDLAKSYEKIPPPGRPRKK